MDAVARVVGGVGVGLTLNDAVGLVVYSVGVGLTAMDTVSRRLTGQHVYLATSCRLWRQFTLTGLCARSSVFRIYVMCLA